MGLPHANARALKRRAALVRATAFALAAAFAVATSAAEARASSPRPDEAAAYEVRTCKGKSFGLAAPEYESLVMHNRARGEAGLPHLCVNPILARAARGHAADMLERDYFSHDSPEGVEPIDRMMDAGYSGYSTYGENIGYATGPLADSEPIFDSLMRSPGHRENILRPGFLEVGVGAVASADGSTGMYAMDFGARPGQPHDYPRLLPSSEGEAPAPQEDATQSAAPPSPDEPPQQGYETSEDSGGRSSGEESSGGEESPEVSDPRQAIFCEIFSETSPGIFADAEADGFAYDFGRTFLDPPSCDR